VTRNDDDDDDDNNNNNNNNNHWLDSPTWALAFLRSFCQVKYPAVASLTIISSILILQAPNRCKHV
jgi:hypothetical protein